MQFDVVIVGGGPVGLAFAGSLSGTGLSVAVVEPQQQAALAAPGFDGREIALTHRSQDILHRLGAWDRIPAEIPSPLREARVLNGGSPYALRFDTTGRQAAELGRLVPNHIIRRALHEALPENTTLLAGLRVTGLHTDAEGAVVTLSDGRRLSAGLVAAADSRFSSIRRLAGIEAETLDFGKAMLVARLRHTLPHDHIATEWFDYGQTMAMLPLNGEVSSLVLTLPPQEIARLKEADGAVFSAEITRRYRGRLGPMELISSRHTYPLVSVYARRFAGRRLALLGDAAVGMHPVTAHGFNFGLQGQDILARRIRAAVAEGRDFAAGPVLRGYEAEHRQATRGLYLATNATALLYTSDHLPARLIRNAALRFGNNLRPVRGAIVSHLMEEGQATAGA
ncbi:5-demethoxyubiquinol-8 5-hydroxylase UbiM [Roseomonas marmotae]|uniref:5-demethoxyubiquinol-8 5-hydroxylase UbiM n=1 Tax=Roseomonas marmotae TaxID=2768161 RepID=A0ABS3K9N8_9PROT|nr:5-demethoxyubiquinol-8 5-hydroxylase UbiM [Roseomonas marmotae]MBO1074176.1 5-demethoxyubiquinol-8 5-hydroxylase UbiM [Roseomonas marmotae]QTI78951.1 5-demethoxyubiquinol-8 5-hydroxylase UbiM [Roseomonas marmotae]